MSEQENRDVLERLVQAFQERDADAIADLVHDDVVEEYPQSGERIRGKHNYLSVFGNIPVMPNVIDYRFTLCGDLAIAERTVESGGNRSYNTAITEMEDGKVKRASLILRHALRSAAVASAVGRKDVVGSPIHLSA